MKRITALFVILLISTFVCGIQAQNRNQKIDSYITSTMKAHSIPGLAMAVILDGEVVHKNYYGKAAIEESELVDEHTIFRIFSATKLITATGVFQLIEKGKISLEDEISMYFNDLPELWKKVKIKNLLTHSSGLPDIIRYKSTLSDKELWEKLFESEMDFKIGNQFRYNQTNYWLLAQIIEKVTGHSFKEYILKNQFKSSKSGVLFSSNSQEKITNRAVRYYYNSKEKKFEKDVSTGGDRAHSGNGLNISMDEFISWNKRLDNDELLAKETKSKMWTKFNFGNKKDEFMHGWGIYSVNGETSFGFTGGNLAGFRKFVDDDLTIILLSNGYIHPAYDIIINDIARIVFNEVKGNKFLFEEDVMQLVLDKKYEKAISIYSKLKNENPNHNFDNLKWNINSVGNSFFRNNKIEEAFHVYRINAEVNPEWWVALAGYADGLRKKGDYKNAINYYQKAIRLNVNNEYEYNGIMRKEITELEKKQ